MRTKWSTIAFAVITLPGVTAWASSPTSPPTVSCDSIISPVGPVSWRPKRVVLGMVALPPAYIPQTESAGVKSWPYWSKSGLVIRANSPPVRVSVPRRWRQRAAISWGNADIVSALRIATCPPSSSLGGWNPYSGGFYLRTSSACVPLTFRVGNRSATVRFGVGKRCG
jgi:hypothetical protein